MLGGEGGELYPLGAYRCSCVGSKSAGESEKGRGEERGARVRKDEENIAKRGGTAEVTSHLPPPHLHWYRPHGCKWDRQREAAHALVFLPSPIGGATGWQDGVSAVNET